jgi:transposase InsO family protein
MSRHFRRQGRKVNRKRIQLLMRLMGIEAIYPKPHTSRPHPEHKIYPYLLRGLTIDRPNQVWTADITYIPMARKRRTLKGQRIYSKRKHIVEPVFGQIKEIRSFRRFSFRGFDNGSSERDLMRLTHNLLKLFWSGWTLEAA